MSFYNPYAAIVGDQTTASIRNYQYKLTGHPIMAELPKRATVAATENYQYSGISRILLRLVMAGLVSGVSSLSAGLIRRLIWKFQGKRELTADELVNIIKRVQSSKRQHSSFDKATHGRRASSSSSSRKNKEKNVLVREYHRRAASRPKKRTSSKTVQKVRASSAPERIAYKNNILSKYK